MLSPFPTRRDFLHYGSGLAVTGFLSPDFATAANTPAGVKPAARSCVLVYLLGGPSHIDMWDLKPNAPAEIRGPFKPIPTSVPGLQICEHLPRLARMAHKYALVRSVSHNNHNHTPMIYYTLTGHEVDQPNMDNDVRPPLRTDFPHVGAVLARFKRSPLGLPGYIAIPEVATRSSIRGEFKRGKPQLLRGGGSGFLGPLGDPLAVDGEPGEPDAVPALNPPRDVPEERLGRRQSLLSVLDGSRIEDSATRTLGELRRQAVVLTGAGSTAGSPSRAFSLDTESPELRERYGDHRFGKSLILARRLAEVGVPMIAINFNQMTVCDGWDTHSKNFEALQGELLPMVDQGLSALFEDLEGRGLVDQTLVVVMGEFGRTPRINKDAGRDHWGSCQSVLLAGGGIKRGYVHGSSDRIAAYPATDPVDPVDIHATIYHCMGLDPEATVRDHLGRPFAITAGRVVAGVV